LRVIHPGTTDAPHRFLDCSRLRALVESVGLRKHVDDFCRAWANRRNCMGPPAKSQACRPRGTVPDDLRRSNPARIRLAA
jgi:hypothetical protein